MLKRGDMKAGFGGVGKERRDRHQNQIFGMFCLVISCW